MLSKAVMEQELAGLPKALQKEVASASQVFSASLARPPGVPASETTNGPQLPLMALPENLLRQVPGVGS